MSIHLFQEDVSVSIIKENFLSTWLSKTIESESKSLGEINIIFCSDEYLLKLNQEHLDHDYFTDILSFDYTEGDIISGDLFISWDRVQDNASTVKVSDYDELCRVCVHGVLHLCGYKDKAEKDKTLMTQKEDFYLSLR
jgi:rRNA maturation RNase YbeY